MWNGKKKAITFSFDDGVTQDIRLVEILNKYRLKCTFNLNSGFFGLLGQVNHKGCTVAHNKVLESQVKTLYQGHEIAVHTLTHPSLKMLDEETIIRQVEEDRKILSRLCGYEIVGMAYPGGSGCTDERVAEIIEKHTPIRYARTTTATKSFDVQKSDLLLWNPTVHHTDPQFESIVESFLAIDVSEPQLLCIWGHAYEMDTDDIPWGKFEGICQRMSKREDIFYGTNIEVLAPLL